MASCDQRQLHASIVIQPTPNHGSVDLLDTALAEPLAQSLPSVFSGREENDPRSVDVESMNHPAAKPPLTDALHPRVAGAERVQEGACLLLAQRMNRDPGWLVESQPARSRGQHTKRQIGLGTGLLVFGADERGDLDLGSPGNGASLGRLADHPALDADCTASQQPPDRRTGEFELSGEIQVETSAAVLLLDPKLSPVCRHAGKSSHRQLRESNPGVRPAHFAVRVVRSPLPDLPREQPETPMARKRSDPNRIAVMDTTLRDGEQTPNVAYTAAEKLQLARMLLEEVGVDRIEIASTRVSEGERDAAKLIADWARKKRIDDRIEILGYSDGTKSVDWIVETGGRVMNLLVKGSERHCRQQLGMTPTRHRKWAQETIRYAQRKRLSVNVWLEDWSNGVRDAFDYVFAMMGQLQESGIARVYLPDTLGIFAPDDVERYVGLMTSTWPDIVFEFHAHNDYSLATANCLTAVRAGARGVHTSVNGMGERTGNACLAEVVAAIHDHTPFRTGVKEAKLAALSRVVETFSGKDLSANSPIVGRDAFTQTAGIHADGDMKGDLYASRLAPDRFGRRRRYALGKLSGKASLDHNLKLLGIELPDSDRELVLRRIVELGDKKSNVGPEDLPYIIADVLKSPEEQLVRIDHYRVAVGTGETPQAEVIVSYRGRKFEASGQGDGGYDAFMNALKKAVKQFKWTLPRLDDFRVRIPPGGRTTALVETVISWRPDDREEETFSTLGVDSDQLAAAVIATEKMLNAIARRRRPAKARSRRAPR